MVWRSAAMSVANAGCSVVVMAELAFLRERGTLIAKPMMTSAASPSPKLRTI